MKLLPEKKGHYGYNFFEKYTISRSIVHGSNIVWMGGFRQGIQEKFQGTTKYGEK